MLWGLPMAEGMQYMHCAYVERGQVCRWVWEMGLGSGAAGVSADGLSAFEALRAKWRADCEGV